MPQRAAPGSTQDPQTLEDQRVRTEALLQGMPSTDPRLYQAILLLQNQISNVIGVLKPVADSVLVPLTPSDAPPPPVNLNYQVIPQAIRLTWTKPAVTTSLTYEVRQATIPILDAEGRPAPGIDYWATGNFLTRTSSTVVEITPSPGESVTFMLKSIDLNGTYSTTFSYITILLAGPSAVSIDGSVIDNNVYLKWPRSISAFNIDYYEIKKGTLVIGEIRGTFATFFETLAGEYTYTITPVDVMGNRGASSSITLLVNQPPDYVLTHSLLSTFPGTKDAVLLAFDPLLTI